MTADQHVRGWGECSFADETKFVIIGQLALPNNDPSVHVVNVHISIITTGCKEDSIVCWGQCYDRMFTSELVGYVGSRPFLDLLL